MSSLTTVEKLYFEKILDMSSGYVLDFSNATFDAFFKGHDIDIYDNEKYSKNGESKARRLRAFWEQDADSIVAYVLNELLDRYEAICELEGRDSNVSVLQKCRYAVTRLSEKTSSNRPATVDEFLIKRIDMPDLHKLPIESALVGIIAERLREAEVVVEAEAHLSAIFLCGSVLEAVLLGAAQHNPKRFNQAESCPKNSEGKVKKFCKWKLSDLIIVACEIGVLEPDVKEFSHGLRSFRNYIHPDEQLRSGFTPDKHTASLCFQVLKLALASVSGER